MKSHLALILAQASYLNFCGLLLFILRTGKVWIQNLAQNLGTSLLVAIQTSVGVLRVFPTIVSATILMVWLCSVHSLTINFKFRVVPHLGCDWAGVFGLYFQVLGVIARRLCCLKCGFQSRGLKSAQSERFLFLRFYRLAKLLF